jgi:UDP-N-acetylglucosamine 2-epimerase (non-hydrolysing)
MSAKRVALVFGTRPEAIKMAPIARAMASDSSLTPLIAVSGQHRVMLDQVLSAFELTPEVDLDIIRPRQSLSDITTAVLTGLGQVLERTRPAAVVVQGDTTTSMAAALAAFYSDIPVIHVEAGLRTNNRRSPFPEEINRRLTTQLAELHLAPTATARRNLLSEGVHPSSIVVTGNTVIDALLWTVSRRAPYEDERLEDIDATGRRIVLVTAHRRESWGEGMARISLALRRLAATYPDVTFVVPMHRNPIVRETLVPALSSIENVILTEPLSYPSFARLMNRSELLLSDSGGLQEEGPSLGKPVLVMRDTTERPEAIDAGTACLVGTDTDLIVGTVSNLLSNQVAYDAMAKAVNPYGDGKAAARSVHAIELFLGMRTDLVSEFGRGH